LKESENGVSNKCQWAVNFKLKASRDGVFDSSVPQSYSIVPENAGSDYEGEGEAIDRKSDELMNGCCDGRRTMEDGGKRNKLTLQLQLQFCGCVDGRSDAVFRSDSGPTHSLPTANLDRNGSQRQDSGVQTDMRKLVLKKPEMFAMSGP
jgi:hypothetical protein